MISHLDLLTVEKILSDNEHFKGGKIRIEPLKRYANRKFPQYTYLQIVVCKKYCKLINRTMILKASYLWDFIQDKWVLGSNGKDLLVNGLIMHDFSKKTLKKLNDLYSSYSNRSIVEKDVFLNEELKKEDVYYREARKVKWTPNFIEYKRYNGILNTLEEYLKLYQILKNTAYYRYVI